MPKTWARYSKLFAALLGLAAEAVSQGFLTGTAAHYVAIVVALATAAGVYSVPNKS